MYQVSENVFMPIFEPWTLALDTNALPTKLSWANAGYKFHSGK